MDDDNVTWLRILKAHQTQVLTAQAAIGNLYAETVLTFETYVEANKDDPTKREAGIMAEQLGDVMTTSETHARALQHVIDILQAKVR